jgi:hypothetical protein
MAAAPAQAGDCTGLGAEFTLVGQLDSIDIPAGFGVQGVSFTDVDAAAGTQVDVCVVNNTTTGRVQFLTNDSSRGASNYVNIGRTNGAGDNGVAQSAFAIGRKAYALGTKGTTERSWTPRFNGGSVKLVDMSGPIDFDQGPIGTCGVVTIPEGFQSLVDENAALPGTQVTASYEFPVGGRVVVSSVASTANPSAKILGRTNGSGDNPGSVSGCTVVGGTPIVFGVKSGTDRIWTPQYNDGSVKLMFMSSY